MAIDMASYVFNAVWSAMPWLRCEVKIGELVITKAKINRLTAFTKDTEQGQTVVPASIVDFLKSDLVVDGMATNVSHVSKISVRMVGEEKWNDFNVGSMTPVGDTYRISLESEF